MLVVLAPAVSSLPKVVLSAIVVHAVWGLARVRSFERYRQVRRNDVVAAGVALVGVLALGPLAGLGVAIAQSILGLVYRSIQVTVDEMGKVPDEKAAWGARAGHPERRTVDGVLVLRLSGPVFWANAATVADEVLLAVDEHPGTRVAVLDLEATNQLDTTTADRLDGLLTRLRARGVDLYLVRVFPDVREVLTRSGFMAEFDPAGRMWHSISAGARAARKAIKAAAPDALPVPVLDGPYGAVGVPAQAPEGVPPGVPADVLPGVPDQAAGAATGVEEDLDELGPVTEEERIAVRRADEPGPSRSRRAHPRRHGSETRS